MLGRRTFLTLIAAGISTPAADAHTLYNQWVVFRQKHLLIGSHLKDPPTYDLAVEVVEILEHLLPEASARAARAPHPERLASLLATGQMFLSVMSRDQASAMKSGTGEFAPYGAIPLTYVEDLGSRLLVSHRNFPPRHAWLVTAALREVGFGYAPTEAFADLERHPGAQAMIDGTAFENMPAGK